MPRLQTSAYPLAVIVLILTCGALPLAAAEAVHIAKLKRLDGEAVRLTLAPQLGASWQEVNVGRVVLRAPGIQQRFPDALLPKSAHLDLDLAHDGCSLLLVDLGPPAAKQRVDAWRQITHTTKIVLCKDAGDPQARLEALREASALTTAKTGSKVEVRPFLSPTLLRPGGHLPICVYFEGAAQAGMEVIAQGPDDRLHRRTTDAVGVAHLPIDASGQWTVRYSTKAGGETYVAELIFAVEPLTFWTHDVADSVTEMTENGSDDGARR